MAHKWRPFNGFSLSRGSKFDNAAKTDEASDTDPVDGKTTSKTPKTTRRFSGSGRKRTQNPLSRFYPSLPEAGVDNDPVVHQKNDIGSDLELLTPMKSKNRRTLLEQIEMHQEEFELMKSDIIVAVMGVTGAGKSTFISLLSGNDIQIGHGQQSCTMNVGAYYFMLNGLRVWLLDTPGFDDTNRLDSVVLKDIAYWLAGAYTKKVQLAGILYLHRITDVRMQGSALRNLRLFNELCGSNNLKSVVLATTHWTHQEGKAVPESVGQARVKELEDTKEFWGGMIDRGSRVVKHDGSKASATRIVSDLVNRHDHVTLDIQKQLVDEKRNLLETDAGQALRRELIDERKRSEARLVELKMDMESALREKDKTWQEQIKQDRLDLEARIRRGTQETEELKANLKKIAQEKDTQLREMERQFKLERAAWQQRLGELGAAMSKIEEHRGPSGPTKQDLSIQAEIVMPLRPKTITPMPEVSETDQDRQNRARAQEFVRWERRQLNALRRV